MDYTFLKRIFPKLEQEAAESLEGQAAKKIASQAEREAMEDGLNVMSKAETAPAPRIIDAPNVKNPVETGDLSQFKDLPVVSDSNPLKNASIAAGAAGLGTMGVMNAMGGAESPESPIPPAEASVEEPSLFERINNKYAEKAPGMQAPVSKGPKLASGPKQPVASEYEETLPVKAEENPADMLKKAMEDRDSINLSTDLGKAGSLIGSSIAGVQDKGQAGFDNIQKRANQPVEDVQKKTDMRKFDPKSQVSKAYRDFAKKIGIKVDENSSAGDLEKLTPLMEKYMQSKEAAEMRKLQYAALNQAKQEKSDQKASELRVKHLADAGKDLDPTSSRAGEFGKQYALFNQADRIKNLVTKGASGLNLTPPEMEEMALGAAKMIGGAGSSSRSQIEALVPHTARGDWQKTMTWLTNKPRGAEQQEFVKRLLGTVQREQEGAGEQLRKSMEIRNKKYGHLKDDPEYKDIYNSSLERFKPSSIPGIVVNSNEHDGASNGKQVVRKGYNAQTDQTQVVYSDGSKEIVKGRQ